MLITRPEKSAGICTRCKNPAITTRSGIAFRQAAKISSLHAATDLPCGEITSVGIAAARAISTPRTSPRLATTKSMLARRRPAAMFSIRLAKLRPDPDSNTASLGTPGAGAELAAEVTKRLHRGK